MAHKDSLGNGSAIRPGDVQRMSAGTGITHSEYNGSDSEAVHLLQIWILPERQNIEPGYEQKRFTPSSLTLVASPDGKDGSVTIHQQAKIYQSHLKASETVTYDFPRKGWVQLVKGMLAIGDLRLDAGDGLAIENEKNVAFKATQDAAFLLFALA